MEITLSQGVRKLVFNRPDKRNAIKIETYKEITNILNEDSDNDNVKLTIITGKGEFFSSGNDFESALQQTDLSGIYVVKDMIDAFIKYPKLLIAIVNGPAIGIGATFIALCDIIYCSDKATFEIPFIRLGLSLEGCSSCTFWEILGKSKASEMLFLNHVMSAKEAYNFRLVAEVIPHNKLEGFIESLNKYGKLPLKTVLRNKKLLKKWSVDKLLNCNRDETSVLEESLQSEEFSEAVISFMQRKSKL